VFFSHFEGTRGEKTQIFRTPDANTAEEVLYFQKGKPIDIEKYLENTYGRVLCYKEMYKIAQEKKPVRTHLMDFMATVCF